VSARTLERYALDVEARIIPALGRMRLSEIQPVDVRRMMGELRDTPRARRGKRPGTTKLSAKAVNHARAVLRAALEDARRDRVLIGDNPAALARPLKQVAYETTILTAAQTADVLRATEAEPLHAFFVLAAQTAMRPSEILGLTWPDVVLDGAAPCLRVRRQLAYVGDVATLADLKTGKSRRTIPLTPGVVVVLRAHRANQARRRLELGDAWRDALGLVFTNDGGAAYRRTYPSGIFKGIVRRLGLPDAVRLYDLRHGAITHMLERGADLKTVADVAGHSTIKLTADTYAHPSQLAVGRAVALLDFVSVAAKG